MDRAVDPINVTADDANRFGDGIRFVVATPAHDAGIRKLLRDTPIPGEISVSMEHEPSHFSAAAIAGTDHRTIVGLKEDRIICMGSISARQRFINGVPTRVGYLSDLRLDQNYRGQASMIRRGYGLMRELHEQNGPKIYLTSIVADNLPARQFLERGLKGMPTYRFVGEFVTLIIARRRPCDLLKPTAMVRRQLRERARRVAYGSAQLVPVIVDLLNADRQKYQFAPVCSAEDLYATGLSPDDFRLATLSDGRAVACAAIWDQRLLKQTVVRGYSTQLRRVRPFINVGATLLDRPRLPAVGQTLSFAFASHLACDPGQPELAEWFIRLLHGPAHRRNIDYLTIGFDARDPRLPNLRTTFHPREYRSRLYAVHWDDGNELARSLDGRLLAPEAALL